MKHKCFKIVILIVLLLGTTLSGCIVDEPVDEDDETPIEEKSDLQIISYKVETQKFNSDTTTYEKIADGFTYNEDTNRYLVSGKVKNNGTENITKAYVYVNFYNNDDILLFSSYDMIFDVAPNQIKDFSADFTKYDGKGFPNVDHVQFSFKQESK